MDSRAAIDLEARVAARNEVKEARLRRTRRMATGLLVLVTAVFAASTAYGTERAAVRYLAVFCEAAMVGALADWFAVTALFRRPLGLPLPHTAILPENKGRIAAQLSEFIQVNFLSSKAIVERIAAFGPAAKLREWLLAQGNARKVGFYGTRLLAFMLGALEDPRIRRFLHGMAVAKLKEVDLAAGAGGVLDLLTQDGRHHALLEEALRLVDEALAKPETQAYIARAVVAESGFVELVKKMGLSLDETIARRVVSGVARAVHEIRADESHELRQRFDAFVAQFVGKLKGDPATREKVNALRDELAANPALAGYVDALWRQFRDWLARDLEDEKSTIHATIAGLAGSLGRRIDEDAALRGWIDAQILRSMPPLVEENRAAIGRFIEDRVNEWHEDRFVREMERELGPDLQFIRINGTVVGGLAGLAIYATSRLLV
ncbi:MAG: DUF445 domain-containing protein [Burkholderiales bacterium]